MNSKQKRDGSEQGRVYLCDNHSFYHYTHIGWRFRSFSITNYSYYESLVLLHSIAEVHKLFSIVLSFSQIFSLNAIDWWNEIVQNERKEMKHIKKKRSRLFLQVCKPLYYGIAHIGFHPVEPFQKKKMLWCNLFGLLLLIFFLSFNLIWSFCTFVLHLSPHLFITEIISVSVSFFSLIEQFLSKKIAPNWFRS